MHPTMALWSQAKTTHAPFTVSHKIFSLNKTKTGEKELLNGNREFQCTNSFSSSYSLCSVTHRITHVQLTKHGQHCNLQQLCHQNRRNSTMLNSRKNKQYHPVSARAHNSSMTQTEHNLSMGYKSTRPGKLPVYLTLMHHVKWRSSLTSPG